MGALRKGIEEGIDISDLLRQLDIIAVDDKLKLNPMTTDIWTHTP